MQLLSLAVARRALWTQASAVPYDEGNTNEVLAVNAKLNLACERFFSSGNWRGTLERTVITAYDSQVTLPRGLQTILGVKRNSSALLVRPIWFEFIGGSCSTSGTYGLNDLGEGFCTFRDIPAASKLVIRSAEGGASGAVMVIVVRTEAGGVSQIEVALSDAATQINSPLVTSIIRINKPETTNSVQVFYIDSNEDEVMLASLLPSETDANYRRYRVTNTTETIEAICKRAYVPASSDIEPLVPNNLGALKLMLMAIQFEDKNDLERAEQYSQKAVALADADRQQFDGDNQTPIFQVQRGYGVADVPRMDGYGLWYGNSNYAHYG